MRFGCNGLLGIAMAVWGLVGPGHAQAGDTLIAVSANFTSAARALMPVFEAQTGHRVRASFGSTGKLYAQIEHGAPFDVFLAADEVRPRKTEANGLAVSGSRFTYARGKLAFWSPKAGLFDDPRTYLTEGRFQHLAIANPATAPYGLAALQVLERWGLSERLRDKLVQGDSIAQTFQFIATGNVDAGFIALSQLRDWHGRPGSLWPVPDSEHDTLNQQAVLLTRARENPAAKAWLRFLKSPQAVAIIEGYGYGEGAQLP
ncbi:molybdate ABC transporter substrate-binding protein [Marinobacter caseinilyticus]|uniref:molybdate ABC transporter substrate-binding protein n=1 Tax=Marinobacter caseinilyticus TaxID=2692195 RepID=UPI00140E8E28|nr:molybdate ABC transporter substrate-binding protein [Marinobacter caseinilyticus]